MLTQQVTKVFPAYVRGPQGAVDQAAVLVGTDDVWVMVRSGGGLPAVWVHLSTPGIDHTLIGRASWSFQDADGEEWSVRAGGGCGCSNPMKHMSAEALLALVSP